MDENRLDVVTIEGLFGERDLELKMATSGPTVLTGSNGTGKSTILRLVYAVSAVDIATLVNAPIRSLRLSFSNIPAFTMTRDSDQDYNWVFEWGAHRDIVTSRGDIGDLPEWVIDALRDNDFPAWKLCSQQIASKVSHFLTAGRSRMDTNNSQ